MSSIPPMGRKTFDAGKENRSIIPLWHLNNIAKDYDWSYIICKSNDIIYIELIQNVFGAGSYKSI